MKPMLLSLPGAQSTAARLVAALGADVLALESRRFPDGETYLRVHGDPAGAQVAVVAALRDPDPQALPLLFTADALRELGASSVGLVAPYLPYMRQDMRFHPGEAITSRSFARFLDTAFDWLVTVEPHLHRHKSLSEIHRVPTATPSGADAIARWLGARSTHAFIVGPDEESEPWVRSVAQRVGCPHVVLGKQRHGDRDVVLSLPRELPAGLVPVIVDDIVASGSTMLQAVRALRLAGLEAPVCVAVHALFDEQTGASLLQAGASTLVSSNTLPHPSNAIDVTAEIAAAVEQMWS